MPKKNQPKTASTKARKGAREEADARASVRDQIAYEYPEGKPIPPKLLTEVDGNDQEEAKTLFECTQDAQRIYWELLSGLEDALDVEIDGTSDLQSMTIEELKDLRGKATCNGQDCETIVGPRDPYFATPCGSYCSDCMETEHAPGCGICASEFDLEGTVEEQPSPDPQTVARTELERLLGPNPTLTLVAKSDSRGGVEGTRVTLRVN